MKILDLGSLNIDLVLRVEHVVRAGETILAQSFGRYPGGKGLNQSLALARAGASVLHVGKLGADGLFLKQMLADAGVDVSHVAENGSSTGTALIQVQQSDGQNCIVVHGGANDEVTDAEIDAALDACAVGDMVLLQNETSGMEHMLRAAKARGLRVAMNPSPISPRLFDAPLELVDCFLLNEVEGAALTGEALPEGMLETLHARYPHALIVLTLGADGCLCCDGDAVLRQECFPVTSVDSTGAGDTFTGYFLAAMAERMATEDALRRAAMAAAIAVTRKGAGSGIPHKDEVSEALREAPKGAGRSPAQVSKG